MKSGGNIIVDGFFIGLLLLAAGALIWWIMPADWERGAADLMQAALPLGDATVVEYQHATLQHSAEAEAVRQCLDKKGPFAVWLKPDGRFVRLCTLPDGKFGLQICQADYDGRECFHEITSFIKNKFTRLEQLIRYLKNIGAQQVWP